MRTRTSAVALTGSILATSSLKNHNKGSVLLQRRRTDASQSPCCFRVPGGAAAPFADALPARFSMFQSYRSILEPSSILEVVDKEILQSLMQAFFYRQGTGLTMLFDDGSGPDADGLTLRRLEPFSTESVRNQDSFHPFCAAFRSDPTKDLLCRKCDERRALAFLTGSTWCDAGSLPIRYPCHMG